MADDSEGTTCGEDNSETGIVWLNVGGKRFATTMSTLRRGGCDNFLVALVEYSRGSRFGCVRDSNGALFIDRSPDLFGIVLEFLRTGTLRHPSAVVASREQVAAEFAFYQIPLEKEWSLPSVDDVCSGRVTFSTPRSMDAFWRQQAALFVKRHLPRLRNAIVLSVMASKPHDHIQFCSFAPGTTNSPSQSGSAGSANSGASSNGSTGESAADWQTSGDQSISFTTPLNVLTSAMFRLFLRSVASQLSHEVGFVVTHTHVYIPPTGAGGIATVCASLAVDLSLESIAGQQIEQDTTAIRQLLERVSSGDCLKTNETTPRYY